MAQPAAPNPCYHSRELTSPAGIAKRRTFGPSKTVDRRQASREPKLPRLYPDGDPLFRSARNPERSGRVGPATRAAGSASGIGKNKHGSPCGSLPGASTPRQRDSCAGPFSGARRSCSHDPGPGDPIALDHMAARRTLPGQHRRVESCHGPGHQSGRRSFGSFRKHRLLRLRWRRRMEIHQRRRQRRRLSASFRSLTHLSEWSVAALSSLSIGAITVQPGGTNVILAGTGDPSTGTGSWYGAGILRSADGGKTWTCIAETDTGLNSPGLPYSFLGSAFAGFAWSTTNPDLVVAAVTESGNAGDVGTWSNTSPYGLYYSPDAGVSWQLATIEDGTQIIQTDQYSDTVSNPATSVVWNPVRSRFYAAVRFHGYYESTDGMTWTRLANQPGTNLTTTLCPPNPKLSGSPACPIFQGVLAVQPVTGDMFALTVDQNNLDQGLWRDVCHVTSGGCSSSIVQFGTRISDQSLETPAGSGTIAQADYDFWLAAVPSQQDTLLFAGTQDIFRCSLANSCAWRNTTNTQTCTAAQVAPAQHAVDSRPSAPPVFSTSATTMACGALPMPSTSRRPPAPATTRGIFRISTPGLALWRRWRTSPKIRIIPRRGSPRSAVWVPLLPLQPGRHGIRFSTVKAMVWPSIRSIRQTGTPLPSSAWASTAAPKGPPATPLGSAMWPSAKRRSTTISRPSRLPGFSTPRTRRT